MNKCGEIPSQEFIRNYTYNKLFFLHISFVFLLYFFCISFVFLLFVFLFVFLCFLLFSSIFLILGRYCLWEKSNKRNNNNNNNNNYGFRFKTCENTEK